MGQELTIKGAATALTTSRTRWSEPDYETRLGGEMALTTPLVPALLPLLEPAEAEEARRALATFEEGLAPCDPTEIDRLMTKLAAAYPPMRISEDEAKARRAVYVELLEDIPFDILARAFKTCGQTHKFYPSAAEIRDAAKPELSRRKAKAARLQFLLHKFETEYRPPLHPDDICKPEDAARIVKEVLGSIGARSDTPDREDRREASKRRAGKSG
jgi:hypothetical protein